AQANSRRYSRKALVTNDASFGSFSIFHYDDKGNQTSVREIHKSQFSRLVKDQMVLQADVFEMRTKETVVAVGGQQKYRVADGLPGDIPAFAGLRDLDLFACHKPEPKTMLCETTILLVSGCR
ncbi:MAG: hypothetical protein WBD32_18080, partial [Acidobacteriaceae bacterium]